MGNGMRLSLMMFLQYMAMPVWFVPLLPYVRTLPGGEDWTLWCGLVMGLGAFTSPIAGLCADRFRNAEQVLAICDFATAVFLSAAFLVRSPALLFLLVLLAMCFYMPTWSLTATIGLAHLPPKGFSRIRVWGTVGWVASGAFSLVGLNVFGIDDFDLSPLIFAAGALLSVLAGLLAAFGLPPTRPTKSGVPFSFQDVFGIRAFVLFRRRPFLIFALLMFCAMIPFQWYNVYCADYLRETGFRHLTATVNLGQIGEICFILLLPWLLGRLGFYRSMIVALSALLFRNLCFLLSVSCGWTALDFGGILVHGLIFGVFIVGSQMHLAEMTPSELRGQAQGLLAMITTGAGVFASNALFARLLKPDANGNSNWSFAYLTAIGLSIGILIAVAVLSCCGRGLTGERPR